MPTGVVGVDGAVSSASLNKMTVSCSMGVGRSMLDMLLSWNAVEDALILSKPPVAQVPSLIDEISYVVGR